jgi:Brp/Blh family beta-carotene 15,15'-monooxygenase
MKATAKLDPRTSFLLYLVPLAVFEGFTLLELMSPGTSTGVCGWPFLISVMLLGMPHGAIDFFLSSSEGGARTARGRLSAFTGYLAALSLSLVLAVLFPRLSLTLFLLLSVIHFGLADARDIRRFEVCAPGRFMTAVSAAARGVLLLSLPFFAQPAESLRVVSAVLRILGDTRFVSDPQAVGTLATAFLIGALVTCALLLFARLRSGNIEAAAIELMEIVVIAAGFVVLHPLFAMGLYLLAWHSWRHMLALGPFLTRVDSNRNRHSWRELFVRLHIGSLPLLLPTLAVFLTLAWWRLDTTSVYGLAAVAIAIFAVVTLPHHLFVERIMYKPAFCSRSL